MALSADRVARLPFQLADKLSETDRRVVFAESCTAGLVSAMLASVPGISRFLCGSAVTYREDTKSCWLGVEPGLIERFTAVSPQVTRSMAENVLQRTPEASLSAAVTGHLGPEAPVGLDGQVFIAIVGRDTSDSPEKLLAIHNARLQSSERAARQREAAAYVLDSLLRVLCES